MPQDLIYVDLLENASNNGTALEDLTNCPQCDRRWPDDLRNEDIEYCPFCGTARDILYKIMVTVDCDAPFCPSQVTSGYMDEFGIYCSKACAVGGQ